jgi:hypothetical protein
MDRYVIELSKSLSNGMKQYLANEKQRPINEIKRNDVADEIFGIILAEIDWNLKHKLPQGTSWEFYVKPIEEAKRTNFKRKNDLPYKLKK